MKGQSSSADGKEQFFALFLLEELLLEKEKTINVQACRLGAPDESATRNHYQDCQRDSLIIPAWAISEDKEPMKTTNVQRCVVSFLTAVVLLVQSSSVLAGEPPDAQLVVAAGAAAPGVPVAGTAAAVDTRGEAVEVTFTKWITTYPAMAGITGGDIRGLFVGEVFQLQTSTNPETTPITRLEAIYEVQADRRSFTALIRGGQTDNGAEFPGRAILDGVILAGWRTGASVHVEYRTISSCAGNPAGPCFKGTIRVEGDSRK